MPDSSDPGEPSGPRWRPMHRLSAILCLTGGLFLGQAPAHAQQSALGAFTASGPQANAAASGGAAPGGHAFTSTGMPLREGTWNSAGAAGPPISQTQYPLERRTWEEPPSLTPPPQVFAPPAAAPPQAYPVPPAAEPWVKLSSFIAEGTVIPNNGGDKALGWTTFEFRTKFEFPQAPMLALAPRFGWHLLDGPIVTDLPGQLYDASLEAILSLPLGESLFMQAAIAPSLFTDGDNTSSDAFRLPARLLLFWNCTETLTLSGGFVYLDRQDIKWFPSAGVIYRPGDDVKVELIVPRPRVAYRIGSDGDRSRWVYVAGELGGGSWAVRRASVSNDLATYGDYRILLGWEQLATTGLDVRFETGLVFNRQLEYRSDPHERSLPQIGLVRMALSY